MSGAAGISSTDSEMLSLPRCTLRDRPVGFTGCWRRAAAATVLSPALRSAMTWTLAWALLTLACAACSSSSEPHPAPAESGADAKPITAPDASATIESAAPATEPDTDPNSLSGEWKLLMGKNVWQVRLSRRPGLPGEFLGRGLREARDENGQLVTMEVGAILEKTVFRAWLGPGVIRCKGSFRRVEPIRGTCTEIDGDPAGPFSAERLPAAR